MTNERTVADLAVWLTFALSMGGCSCSRTADYDAGVDAGHDAGVDAGRDGGHDAGRDAGRRDAGPPGDAGWTRVTDHLPDDCLIEIAADPVAAVGMHSFRDCPDTAPGCRELIKDWPAIEGSAPAYRFQLRMNSGYHDGVHGYFSFTRPFDFERDVVVLLRDDGLPVMAYRAPHDYAHLCYAFGHAVNDGHMLVDVALPVAGDVAPSWIAHAPLTDRVTSLSYLTTVTYPFTYLQDTGVSSAQGALKVALADHIERIGWDGTVTRVAVGTGAYDWGLQAVVGSTIFYDGLGARSAIYAARGTATGEVLIDPVDAEAAAFDADGRDMVWLQFYGRQDIITFDRAELWASPYTNVRSEVVPRQIGVMPFGNYKPVRLGWGAAVVVENY